MKSNAASSGVSRRALVSTLAALPVSFGTLFPASVHAQTATGDPLPSWNDGAQWTVVDMKKDWKVIFPSGR